MLHIREHIPLRPKTTLRIGGAARYYAELKTKEDIEEAASFAGEKNTPLIVLGGGSNTIFADGTIEALVVRIVADEVEIEGIEGSSEKCVMPSDPTHSAEWVGLYRGTHFSELPEGSEGNPIMTGARVTAEAGKNLANLIAGLAERNLDLSPLTGIPGTVGGAIFGNSGQGFGGTWIGRYVENVEVCIDGQWRTFTREECGFGYRTSAFKHWCHAERNSVMLSKSRRDGVMLSGVPSGAPQSGAESRHGVEARSTIIWSATLNVPSHPRDEINAEIERLLQRRIETQPHAKTAGSCFLSISKDTPAWKLIDTAGLRGHRIGDIKISEKHANFLINEGDATFEDVKALVTHIQSNVSTPLAVEMRFVEKNGHCLFG